MSLLDKEKFTFDEDNWEEAKKYIFSDDEDDKDDEDLFVTDEEKKNIDEIAKSGKYHCSLDKYLDRIKNNRRGNTYAK